MSLLLQWFCNVGKLREEVWVGWSSRPSRYLRLVISVDLDLVLATCYCFDGEWYRMMGSSVVWRCVAPYR